MFKEKHLVLERPAEDELRAAQLSVAGGAAIRKAETCRKPADPQGIPLSRLHEKMKRKRSKHLIGDLMQLSS